MDQKNIIIITLGGGAVKDIYTNVRLLLERFMCHCSISLCLFASVFYKHSSIKGP